MDSSFAGDGDGSERRSPREMFASSEGDFDAFLALWLPFAVVMEIVGREKASEGVFVEIDREDDVVEAEDRTTIPATGIRTMQRRRLSKPWVPSCR